MLKCTTQGIMNTKEIVYKVYNNPDYPRYEGDDYLDAYGISCKKYLQGIKSGDIEPTPEIVNLILSGYSTEQ